jgi:nucleoside-diphosphate-sugar epimerase
MKTQQKQTILITGATGFYGRWLLPRLLEEGHTVVAITAPGDEAATHLPDAVTCISADITQADDINRALGSIPLPGIALHMAGLVAEDGLERNLAVNFQGTVNLLRACQKTGIKRFIHVSAVAACYDNRTAYGESKYQAEKVVNDSPLCTTIVRPTLTYGKGGKEFEEFLDFLSKFPIVPMIGPGRALKQPVCIGDVVQALELLIEADSQLVGGKTYNVSGADTMDMNQMINAIQRNYDLKRPVIHLPNWFCGILASGLGVLLKHPPITREIIRGINQAAVLDHSEIAGDLGYQPLTLEEGLAHSRSIAPPS